jgi:hypothetical protein
MNLYEEYIVADKTKDLDDQERFIINFMKKHRESIPSLFNRAATCYGPHKVYVVHMTVDGVDMIKVGYTKNSIKDRYKEKRWKDYGKIVIIKIYRQEILQALGAVNFEDELKSQCLDYLINSNLEQPGKGEFMDFKHLDIVLNLYDNLYPQYTDVVGFKRAN